MATVYESTFDGNNNINTGTAVIKRPGEKALAPTLQEVADDLGDLLAGIQALADKLDADATVTDTDYRATLDAAVTTLKTARG